jgi:hypothetical protein
LVPLFSAAKATLQGEVLRNLFIRYHTMGNDQNIIRTLERRLFYA